MEGYNSTDRPMKKTRSRMMVDFLLCIGFSLMLWGIPPAESRSFPPGKENTERKRNYSSIMFILFLVTSSTPVDRAAVEPKTVNSRVPMPPVSGSMEPVLLTTWTPEPEE